MCVFETLFHLFCVGLLHQSKGKCFCAFFRGFIEFSLCLVTSVFHVQVVGVSAVTGSGLDEFFVQVAEAAKEYET